MLVELGAITVLVVPWLNPFTSGPTSSVMPWLVAATCAMLVLAARSRLTAQVVVGAWLFAGLGSALIGVLQYFGHANGLAPWVHGTAVGEAFANLRQRNHFATLSSIGLLALLWQVQAWQDEPPRFNSPGIKFSPVPMLFGLAAVLLALGNGASGSRTGLFQWTLIAGFALFAPARAPRPSDDKRAETTAVATVALFALAVYGVAALALPSALQAVAGVQSGGLLGRFQETAGCSSRSVLWANVLHLIVQKPWTGWGWGNLDYAHFMTLYPGERFCDILDNAHNLPLHLAVELGIPVAVALCSLCTWLVWRSKPWAEKDATRQLAWGVLAVIGLHSLLEYPLWYGPFQLAAALCVWMLWRSKAPANFYTQKERLAPAGSAYLAIILIVGCGYAAWDYWRISQIYLAPAARHAAYRDNTLSKIQGSWLFRDQVRFAELTTTTLTPANAAHINALAKDLMHFSPESRVVEKVIESAVMLGDDAQALFYLERFKAAFPEQHARWSAKLKPRF
jgi:O-antigen ligase